jgi:glycine cleavage system H lipoate-binding protein
MAETTIRCPFLREQTVASCASAPLVKALPRQAIDPARDRCSRRAHRDCVYAVDRATSAADTEVCPSLAMRRVHYCAAVPAPTLVPGMDMLSSRCTSRGHRHCGTYLERGGNQRTLPSVAGARGEEVRADPALLPGGLGVAHNHLWIERDDNGACTVGVDAFLARVVGEADRITFLPTLPGARPFALLSVAGLELPLLCPCPLERVAVNHALLGQPRRLTADPYGAGWLFEGRWPETLDAESAAPGRLLSGPGAVEWLRREEERLSAWVHEVISRPSGHGWHAAAAGGTFAIGLVRMLSRAEAMRLLAEFFPTAPAASGGRPAERARLSAERRSAAAGRTASSGRYRGSPPLP